MRPGFFYPQLAPITSPCQGKQPKPAMKTAGRIAVNLDRYFATASLRLEDTGQGDEFADNAELLLLPTYSNISSTKRL
jgi:hypothetical protein